MHLMRMSSFPIARKSLMTSLFVIHESVDFSFLALSEILGCHDIDVLARCKTKYSRFFPDMPGQKKFSSRFLLGKVQRPKKSKLSGWQTLTRKNFPDEARKSFSRQIRQKSA